MENLGKATVQGFILNSLPGINKEPTKFNFDVSAWNWNTMVNSNFSHPLLTEMISDENERFAALHPSRRKLYVDNFLEGTTKIKERRNNGGVVPYIPFTPVEADNKSPLVNDFINPDTETPSSQPFDEYELLQPDDYTDGKVPPEDYQGPQWRQDLIGNILPPNDDATIKKWYEKAGIKSSPPVSGTSSEKTIQYINQTVVRDGLYWGVESGDFLKENMPFWVNLSITRPPPSASHPTWFVISLGIDDEQNSFDILLTLNGRARIIDYHKGRELSSTEGGAPWQKEFSSDLSKITDEQKEIEVGIMTVAGRIVVWVNQMHGIYTRSDRDPESGDDSGTLRECKIAKGKIRIYGSNVQAKINVCPMVFAPLSVVALPIPSVLKDNGQQLDIPYQGVKNDGTFGGSVCVLPQQPDKKGQLYGVDCSQFVGDGGEASPEGFGMHQKGIIGFQKASSTEITTLPNADFYILYMIPEDVQVGQVKLKRGGTPYFFRIKGGAQRLVGGGGGASNITHDIISASENSSAPDYFHALTTANVTLYNKGGRYDDLRNGQSGIVLRWGWGGNTRQTFTGIVTSTTTGEQAGMETITLQCEDYMHILKNVPIVNSPFYDGMVAYNALEDLAERAGIRDFARDWEEEEDYFLPSGYSFSKPAMRFSAKQNIFECMINILKRFEAFMYFDSLGILHINKLPGGLFSDTSGGTFSAEFGRNPNAPVSKVILDEKQIEYNFASTVNRINIWTLNRDTRASVLYTKSAKGLEDNVLYRKVTLRDQAALGDIETARTWAERLGFRLFFPIRKAAFKTVGLSAAEISTIFDFVKVDGDEFRLMGVKRDYSADENSFTNEYNVEWLGGK